MIVDLMNIDATFEGGTDNLPTTQLNFQKARLINDSAGCSEQGVDATTLECLAYQVFSELIKMTVPDRSSGLNYHTSIPEYKAQLQGLKVTVKRIEF